MDAVLVEAVLVDGRSGAGKTRFADELGRERGARVIHLDDIYPGWRGLAAASRVVVDDILRPLSLGEPATWRQWDWHADRFGGTDHAEPGESLVIEGCGSLTRASRELVTEALWLTAPEVVRHARILARDGDDSWWALWRAQEDEHLGLNDPESLADRVIDTGRRD